MKLIEALEKYLAPCERVPPGPVVKAAIDCCAEISNDDMPVDVVVRIIEGFVETFCLLPRAFLLDRDTAATQMERDHKPGMSVPLYDILPIHKAILELGGSFFQSAAMEGGFFSEIRQQLTKNENIATGITPLQRILRQKKIPDPDELGLSPYELVEAYCRHTPLYPFFCTRVPFTPPRSLWPQHAFFLGPTGWGKSQLLGTILREAVEDPEQRTIIVLDPHAQKDKSVFRLARERMPPDRLVVIDPDTNPPDIGLMDYGVLSPHDALDTFKFLMTSLAGGLSPKQETSLPNLFELLSKIPDASLVTLHEIITEKPKKGQPLKYANAIAKLDDVHRDFFENLFYTANYQETKDALQWKMLAALGKPTFKKMFSATRNSINMDEYLREPKIVLVSGAEQALGKDGMRIFILFLVGQFYAAAKRRKAHHLAMCIIDEAWMVLQSTLISDILVELRGFHCSLVCATQIWNQIAEPVRPAVLGSTAIKGVGALHHNDAVVLARDMFATPDQIRNLNPYAGEGTSAQWLFHLTGMKQPHIVSVPYGVLESMPNLADEPVPSAAVHTDRAPRKETIATKQQRNELSLRDTDLPLPQTRKAPAMGTSAVTSIDANGRIDKSLRVLASALQPVIERELRRLHGDRWQQQISAAVGSNPGQPLDPYATLKTMLDNWQSCFKSTFKVKTRTDISKALEARNAISHASGEIPPADAISYLTSVRDIAIAISAKSVADTLSVFISDQLKAAASTPMQQTFEVAQREADPAPSEFEIKPGKNWEDE